MLNKYAILLRKNVILDSGIKTLENEELLINFDAMVIDTAAIEDPKRVIIPSESRVIEIVEELKDVSANTKWLVRLDGVTELPTADEIQYFYASTEDDIALQVFDILDGGMKFLSSTPGKQIVFDGQTYTALESSINDGILYDLTENGLFETAIFTANGWKIDNSKNFIPSEIQRIDGKIADLESENLALQAQVDLKANAADTYTKVETDAKVKELTDRADLQSGDILTRTNGKNVVSGTYLDLTSDTDSNANKIATRDVVLKATRQLYSKDVAQDASIKTVSDKLNTYDAQFIDIKNSVASKFDATTAYTKAEVDAKDAQVKSDVNAAIAAKANSVDVYTKAQVYTKTEVDSSQQVQDQKSASLDGRVKAIEDATAFLEQVYKWDGVVANQKLLVDGFDLKTLPVIDGSVFTFSEGEKVELAIQRISTNTVVSHPVTMSVATNAPVQFLWAEDGGNKAITIDPTAVGTLSVTFGTGVTASNYRIFEVIKKAAQSSVTTYVTVQQADAKYQLKDDSAISVAGYTADQNTAKKINYIDTKVEQNKVAIAGKIDKPASGTTATSTFLVKGDGTLQAYTAPTVDTSTLQTKSLVAKPATMTATTVEGAITEIFDTTKSTKAQSDTDHADLAALTARVVTVESAVKLDDTSLVALETLLGL